MRIPKFVFTVPEKIRKSLVGERATSILDAGEKAIRLAKVLQQNLRNAGPIDLNQRSVVQRGGIPIGALLGLASLAPFAGNALNRAIQKI